MSEEQVWSKESGRVTYKHISGAIIVQSGKKALIMLHIIACHGGKSLVCWHIISMKVLRLHGAASLVSAEKRFALSLSIESDNATETQFWYLR